MLCRVGTTGAGALFAYCDGSVTKLMIRYVPNFFAPEVLAAMPPANFIRVGD
jgi:hypothetical protein